MSEIIERVAKAIWSLNENTDCNDYDQLAPHAKELANSWARAAIEAMRPEFERISESYSPRGDDTVWVDDRTPIGQYVDSIINRVYA